MENENLKKEIILETLKNIKDPFKLLTVHDVSKELNIGINQAYELFKQKDFPTIHIGKRKNITLVSFLIWKMNNHKESD